MIRSVLTLLCVWACGTAQAECAVDSLSLTGEFGTARFHVSVADDADEQARGLMHVTHMPVTDGMLFVFDTPRTASFWMRNTLIPLDMIFADAEGTVVSVHDMAIPLDETPIFGGDEVQYVLEINGGLAHRLGIAPGAKMVHPTLQPSVCE